MPYGEAQSVQCPWPRTTSGATRKALACATVQLHVLTHEGLDGQAGQARTKLVPWDRACGPPPVTGAAPKCSSVSRVQPARALCSSTPHCRSLLSPRCPSLLSTRKLARRPADACRSAAVMQLARCLSSVDIAEPMRSRSRRRAACAIAAVQVMLADWGMRPTRCSEVAFAAAPCMMTSLKERRGACRRVGGRTVHANGGRRAALLALQPCTDGGVAHMRECRKDAHPATNPMLHQLHESCTLPRRPLPPPHSFCARNSAVKRA